MRQKGVSVYQFITPGYLRFVATLVIIILVIGVASCGNTVVEGLFSDDSANASTTRGTNTDLERRIDELEQREQQQKKCDDYKERYPGWANPFGVCS